MTHPAEARIRTPDDREVYEAIRAVFPGRSDQSIIADLARLLMFVAVSWNDIVEDGQPSEEVLDRKAFVDIDELSGFFPWPDE